MEEFSELLSLFPKISEQARVDFSKCLFEKKVTKGTLLLKQGEICRDMFFIKKGLVHDNNYITI